jgi:hypothetical protein
MKMGTALSSAMGLVCLVLSVGCSAGADGSDGANSDTGEVPLKVAQPTTEHFDYAPQGGQFQAAKVQPDDSLSPKGSASRKFGNTYMRQISIPNGGIVGCYTAGDSVGADPVLALFRRSDNAIQTTPYTEKVWVQTLAINDDSSGVDPYLSFTNTSGSTLNAYLMAFAYGNSTGTAQLWCTGSQMENITLAAGSVRTTVGSGTASTSGSNGDPWLFQFDETPALSYWGNWNDDVSGANAESSFPYSGPSRTSWFVANGWGSGTTTINF